MELLNVVVIGEDHFNTLGLVRSLGEDGIHPIVIIASNQSERSWVLKSKYIDHSFSAVKKSNEIVETLIEIGKINVEPIFLIPSSDVMVEIIAENYTKLSQFYVLPNVDGSGEALHHILDKSFASVIAEKVGFLVPTSVAITANSGSERSYALSLMDNRYPVIIKEDRASAGKNKTRIIYDEGSLIDFLDTCGSDNILIQQYIVKDEELGIQGIAVCNQKIDIPAVIHKIRTSIGAMGSTTYALISKDCDCKLLELCYRFIKESNYTGIFDIEVMKKDTDYYFIECNFRNGAYGYAYTRLGYNLPKMWIDAIQDNKPREQIKSKMSLHLMNVFSDIKHISKDITIFKWFVDFIRCSVFLTYNINDQRPFWCRLSNKLRK